MSGPLCHLFGDLGEPYPFRRGEEVHLKPLRLKANLSKKLLGIIHPSFSADITFQVMAGALQSASDKDSVGSLLKGP